MFQAQVFTLYPEVFPGPLSKGLYGKALSNKLWNLSVINIRDAATDKHKTVDDTPYGGGTGMLLKADVLANSLDKKVKKGEKVFYLSPKGKKFDQKLYSSPGDFGAGGVRQNTGVRSLKLSDFAMDVSLSSFLNQIFKQHVQFNLQENTSLSEAFQRAGDIWKF